MAVAYEHERQRADGERRRRGLVREHVLPYGIARASVVQRDAVALVVRLELVEECARVVGEDVARPACGDGGVTAELVEVDRPAHGEVMVPAETDLCTRLDDLAAFVRPRAVADDVAEAPDLVRRAGVDRREDRLERGEIRVHVGDDRDQHRPKLVRRAREPSRARST